MTPIRPLVLALVFLSVADAQSSGSSLRYSLSIDSEKRVEGRDDRLELSPPYTTHVVTHLSYALDRSQAVPRVRAKRLRTSVNHAGELRTPRISWCYELGSLELSLGHGLPFQPKEEREHVKEVTRTLFERGVPTEPPTSKPSASDPVAAQIARGLVTAVRLVSTQIPPEAKLGESWEVPCALPCGLVLSGIRSGGSLLVPGTLTHRLDRLEGGVAWVAVEGALVAPANPTSELTEAKFKLDGIYCYSLDQRTTLRADLSAEFNGSFKPPEDGVAPRRFEGAVCMRLRTD